MSHQRTMVFKAGEAGRKHGLLLRGIVLCILSFVLVAHSPAFDRKECAISWIVNVVFPKIPLGFLDLKLFHYCVICCNGLNSIMLPGLFVFVK